MTGAPASGVFVDDVGGVIRAYSLDEFLTQAQACKPAVLELLWLPARCYEQVEAVGEQLIRVRESFLSGPAVRREFLAEAIGLMRDLEYLRQAPEEKGMPPRSYRMCSTARLLAMTVYRGTTLYRTGQMVVRLPEPDAQRCRDFAHRLVTGSGWDLDPAQRMLSRFGSDLRSGGTPLPGSSACVAAASM